MKFGINGCRRSTRLYTLAIIGLVVGGFFISQGNNEGATAFMGLVSMAVGVAGLRERRIEKRDE